jgi:UDP-N-acetylglucosamine--N-acetylmuramyl-(pentapeptide) pyrophosphoryl-undecaprenol N-acetylglucosamine transferase
MTVPLKKLLIAGGGTGGHIFPGIAVAQEWVRRGGEVVFVGTPRGLETKLIPQAGFRLLLLNVGILKGGGIIRKIKTVLGLPFALLAAWRILKTEKPVAVFGIGGFASGPACVAAWLMRLPTAIMDQNAHPGFTNRTLGKWVRKVFISFEPARAFFPAHKVTLTGNPVRSAFQPTPCTYNGQGQFNLLIFGGSQGAVAINQAFTGAVDLWRDAWPRLHIEHNAGASDDSHSRDGQQS